MKLDVIALKYLSKEDFRVLTAVEMGQKNHELVPTTLIESIASLRRHNIKENLSNLLKVKTIHHEKQKYDGYRLTSLGYDYLAINTFLKRNLIKAVGRQIGTGKESDIFEVVDETDKIGVLKIHRLGRTSFRAVKSKRDYLNKRSSFSWLYLSRLSAIKEFSFMKALQERGFSVPQAVDNNRHAILMSFVQGRPLYQVTELENPQKVYIDIIQFMTQLAQIGLVHCDLNEFNIMVDQQEIITVIDFPQMVSIEHENAQELFERDLNCIVNFFNSKIKYDPSEDPVFSDVGYKPDFQDIIKSYQNLNSKDSVFQRIDTQLAASGFKNAGKHNQTFIQSQSEDSSNEAQSETDSSDQQSQ